MTQGMTHDVNGWGYVEAVLGGYDPAGFTHALEGVGLTPETLRESRLEFAVYGEDGASVVDPVLVGGPVGPKQAELMVLMPDDVERMPDALTTSDFQLRLVVPGVGGGREVYRLVVEGGQPRY